MLGVVSYDLFKFLTKTFKTKYGMTTMAPSNQANFVC